MAKIYVFVNQKGGVGKTTSAVNIGAYIAQSGKKVLLVDFDSQGNMSTGVGVSKDKNKGNDQYTIYDLLTTFYKPQEGAEETQENSITAQDVVQHTSVQNLDAIIANTELAGAAVEFFDEDLVAAKDRYFILKYALEPLKASYDYILIDCPPSLGILTINGLAAADAVLIPMQCEYFALEGITLLLETVEQIQKNVNEALHAPINKDLKIGGIFFTMYDSRTLLAQDVVKQVKRYFDDKVFSTIIPRNVRLSEAPSFGKPICLYDPACLGAKSYQKLAEEVVERG